ncbi:hypothetical protein MBLNU459_g8517t2 [Dothideomycetes sp. NU459]
MTKNALLDRGYEVIEWTPPSHGEATQNLFKIFGSTAGKAIRDAIDASGEPAVPQLKAWYGQDGVEPMSTEEFWGLCKSLHDFRIQYARYWKSASSQTSSGRPIDGVILPVTPSTAVREGHFHYFGYSAVVNALDFVSCTFPVTLGDGIADAEQPGEQASRYTTNSTAAPSYFDSDIHGAPVGLQVMCQRHQEERVLGLVEAISEALSAARS